MSTTTPPTTPTPTTTVLATTIEAWFADLRADDAVKQELAASSLATIDRARARDVLLACLKTQDSIVKRRAIARCLHYVADVSVVWRIVDDLSLDFFPRLVPPNVLVDAYQDLRQVMPTMDPPAVIVRLRGLGVLESPKRDFEGST